MYFCEKKKKTVKFYHGSVKMQDGFGYILTGRKMRSQRIILC